MSTATTARERSVCPQLRRPSARAQGTRLHVDTLVSFGEDGRGRVYAISLNGPIYP